MKSGFAHCMRRTLGVTLLVLACCALVSAQSTTEGSIGGTVFDKTGAVVGQATVVVHNNGTNAEFPATTDASGYFRVNALQPGTYTVTISRQGFAAFKAEKVIVTVGSLTEVSPHLEVGSGGETVDVTAEAPLINVTSPEFAPTLDQTAIANLPINGGRWSNFALLTPGVVSDSNAFGLLSFRGISTLLNNNTVDGADNNQAFFSEERGRTRIGYSTPKEAVQEFQVNTSNYSSEYGRSAGGVVNTVTKSGTNSIHGEAYGYDRDNSFGAFNEFTQINVQNASGAFVPVPLKPTNKRWMTGFGVGGPVVKDKLFWFLAYDWYHNNFPGVAVTSNPNVFFAQQTVASANIIQLAKNINHTSAPTAAQTAAALTTYNSDLTALNSLLGVVPRTGDQNIIFPKLDWQINNANHASFSFNRMRWNSPAGIQTAATVTRGVASFGNDYVKETWGVAKLDTSITSNLINEFRFQYGRDFEFEFSQPPAAYEQSTLLHPAGFTNPFGLPPSVSITNGFTFGVPTFLQRPAFPDEARGQVADTISWSRGKHTFKFGFDVSHVDDNSQNLSTQFGSYSYSSLVNYFTDLNTLNGCFGTVNGHANTPVECYSSYAQAFGPIGFEFQTNDLAFFMADDWKFSPRLSFSFGVRWEYEMMPAPFSNLINAAVPQTGHLPADFNNFGPRAGFAWDIFGNGKTVLRGGYGIYYGRIINSTVFNAMTNTGVAGGQNSLSFTPTSTTPVSAPVFPQVFASLPVGGGRNIVFFDPNFQNPQIHQIDLMLERDLGWGTMLRLSYLGSLGRELPDFVDTNLCAGAGVTVAGAASSGCTAANTPGTVTYSVNGGGPLNSSTYSTILFKGARPNAAFGSMTDIFSGINSSYNAFVVEVNHRMSHNIQFAASYTYSHALDYGQNQTTFTGTNFLLVPNNIALEKGNSIYDIPNRFVFNAIANSPWKVQGWAGWLANGWQLSPILQIQNGLPYTLSVSGNAPGGTVSGINGSGGTNRLDVLGNNSFRMPLTWEPDVRISKTLKFQERYELELMTDFFNIANKQNVMSVNNSGYSIATSGGTCSSAAPCLNFNPTFGTITSTNNSNFLYTPRQIQLGARFKF